MGLRAKFNLVLAVAFAIGFAITAFVLDRVFMQTAREEVVQNARIMMTAANAIRRYVSQDLGPLLPLERDGKFVPDTVPAYAAQRNFRDLQAAFPGYSYREATLNPTNLADRAQDWEADIVAMFRNEPARGEIVVERQTPYGATLNLARPIPVGEEACLTCHSTPSAAPASLIRSYGAVNGFAWKLHETIGAQILTVPMDVPLRIARSTYLLCLSILAGVFAVVMVILNLLLNRLVITPVQRLSAMADAVSLGDESVAAYTPPGRDEIASLSVSFNRMRESVRQAMAMIG